MNKRILLCMILAAGCQGVFANGILNPGFEDGDLGQFGSVTVDHWTTYGTSGWHHSDPGAVIGQKAVKQWSDDTGLFQDFPAVVGNDYTFSVHAITLSSDNGGLGGWDAVFKVEWRDEEDYLILDQTIGRYYGVKSDGSSGQPGDPVDTWKFIEGQKIAPFPAAVGRVVMYLTAGDGGHTQHKGSINWDEVSVTLTYGAEDPQPAHGASNLVPSEVTELSWQRPAPRNPGDTIRCDVWFGTDPNMPGLNAKILDYQESDSVAIGPLDSDQTYYWRVDCYDPNVAAPAVGWTWTFNTGNMPPVVDAGPRQKSWLQDGSAQVQMTAEVSDDGQPDPPGQLTYLWTVESGPAAVAFDPSDQVEDPTLTVTAPGRYELTLTVSDGAAQADDTVIVDVYEEGYTGLIAHWSFDEASGDIAYDSVSGHHGTLVGDPARVSGKVGGALELDGDGDYVDCGGAPVDPNVRTWADLTSEITLAAWVQGSFDKPWQSIVTKGDNSWRLIRYNLTEDVIFALNNVGDAISGSTGPVSGSRWHHLVGVYDGSQIRLYVDGMLAASATAPEGQIAINDYNVRIGSDEQFDGQREFAGRMDEVRLYEIGLTDEQVLDLFIAEGGSNSCGQNFLPGDVDGDCYVTLDDVAILAQNWMECNDITNPACW